MINLQNIVGTQHVWVVLHVKRLQEGQGYSVVLQKADEVVALAHGRIWTWVIWAAQDARGWGQHLAAARNCMDTDAIAYLAGKKIPTFVEILLMVTVDVS